MEVTAGLRELAPSKGSAVEQKVQTVSGYADDAGKAFARLAKVSHPWIVPAPISRSGERGFRL